MNLLRHAHIITTKTTTKNEDDYYDDDSVGIRRNFEKYGRGKRHMRKVSQPMMIVLESEEIKQLADGTDT
jgi:hypothetical protein